MRKFSIITSAAFVLASIYTQDIGGFLFFTFCLLIFIFQNKINDFTDRLRTKKYEATYCIAKEDHILFPKGYYFKQGYLKSTNKLPYSIINEIRINTFPHCVKINGNELIFLRGMNEAMLTGVGLKHNIPITNPQDNWYLILEEFLDTEHEDDWKKDTIKRLEETGITEEDVKNIRKKFFLKMMLLTYYSWEWVYYGQYDLLSQIWPLTEKKYWWTMNIALKEKNQIISK